MIECFVGHEFFAELFAGFSFLLCFAWGLAFQREDDHRKHSRFFAPCCTSWFAHFVLLPVSVLKKCQQAKRS